MTTTETQQPLLATDLESVLTPEIWPAVAEATGIDELRLTTRDVADYDHLMRHRIAALEKHNLRLPDLTTIINKIEPLPGALEFLRRMRKEMPVVVLSDTYYALAAPLIEKLEGPAVLCNTLLTDSEQRIIGYRLRQQSGKRHAVEAFRTLNYSVIALGDSFNDVAMLQVAHHALLIHAPPAVAAKLPQARQTTTLSEVERIVLELIHT